ncbi:chromatin associated protein KTI12 [Catenaria anguillulae PL171]|uniref:Chromatin associated protein KTI12 n=1 Tax=Catenaria anguillulae PL171 TaxID=765915 RepID=A0A1Y2HK51_9FUNG|nr:chromatin associated protein KTI12 [Catenaria anguillulae PL171]
MPLIILSGYPCSGKTTRAQQLHAFFSQPRPDHLAETAAWPTEVHIVNDESLRVTYSHYNAPVSEKKARGAMLSAVERLLSRDALVIADGMNYIKGFRYQLYCIARAIGTPHCVIHCGAPLDLSRQWNAARPDGQRYDEQIFEELVTRYEEPDGKNRWDSPLFFIMNTDELPPFDKLIDAIVLRKPPPPNMSTVVKPLTDTNYLFELDKATNELVTAYFQAQNNHPPGSQVALLDCTTKIRLPGHKLSLPQLRGLRRQFLSLNNQRTVTDVTKLKELFIAYLQENVNQ